MKDKVVVVTGAGQGIGRSIALELSGQGAKIVVNDLGTTVSGDGNNSKLADDVVAEIIAQGGEAVANTDSVSSWDSGRAIVQTAIDAFGRIDGVVNNAGILRDSIFHKMSEDEWRGVVETHLFGGFYVSRAAAEHFREQDSGAFVFMTSTTGLIGNFGQANYGAAKLGIVALSKAIALDMARYNVRSNCISPFAWSRMIGAIPDTPDQQERVAKLKTLTPQKVSPLAVYLLSDQAAGVTGQVFAMRGNELFLMSQHRPMKSVCRPDGWTPETIATDGMPALKSGFYGLDRTADVFHWDPV